MNEILFGAIDVQRGFIPADEGEKMDRAGFGELPVPDGQAVIDPIRAIIRAAGSRRTFTTQDDHPEHTAHFSNDPDFVTNWPVHCVGGTLGAMLHPRIESALMPSATRFYKGQEELEDGKDDLSYSGYYGATKEGLTLPDWLMQRQAKAVVLGGLALDYCVGKTALDLKQKLGLDVYVALDATRGITDASSQAMRQQFVEAGVQTITANEAITMFKETN